MTKWVDENTIEGEMSDADFKQAVTKCMQDRVKKESEEGRNYGSDGLIEVYRERRVHRGIPYELAVIRYFFVRRLPDNEFELIDLELPSGRKGINRVGKYVVVEGERLPRNLGELLGLDEFLWHDTLHFWQQDWPLRQQWEYAEKLAIKDCERLLPNLITRLRKGSFLETVVICVRFMKRGIVKLAPRQWLWVLHLGRIRKGG